jgi:hypothetical protein
MIEMIDELDSRQLELGLLMGAGSLAQCGHLLARFGPHHPCAVRVIRCRGMLEHLGGDDSTAANSLLEALRLGPSTGFERALTLRALVAVAPNSAAADGWRAEAETILHALGVHTAPPLLLVSAAVP